MALGLRSFAVRLHYVWKTLKLRFVFVRHCDVFFVELPLRYLFV